MSLLTAKLQKLFAYLFVMAIVSATAFAEVPDAPQDLMVYPEFWEDGGAVNLFWIPSEGNDITYKIYRADGKTEDLTQFSLLDDDKYKIYDENDFGVYAIVEHGFKETYSYYVTASNSDGESDASNIVNIKLFSPNDFVEIISQPKNLSTKINEEWTYIVKAKSNQDGDILFALDEAPDGVEIDEVTGKITWAPTEGGFYFFSVRAYLEDEEDLFTTQSFNVIVNECEIPAVISGQVTDENGKPIKMGMVTLYTLDDDNSEIYLNSYRFVNGEYEFEVDEGAYTFQVEGFADKDKIIYEPQFYKFGWFYLNCGEALSANFVLKTYNWEKEQIFIVSQPPRTAVIGEELTYQVEIEYDGDSEIIYELQNAPDGATISETGLLSWTPEENGYYDFGLMVHTDNQMSHNFQHFMIKVLSCDNPASISGVVTDEEGEPIEHGNVFLLNVGERDDSLYIDDRWGENAEIIDGEYTFGAVDEGEYVLYFEGYGYINEKGYVPEYYNDAKDYEDAEVLTINCEDALTINAELQEMPDWNTYIRFTSEPVRVARIDEEYTYDVDAETNYEDGVIVFGFEYAPEGAEIDAETGLITWTPTESGMYEFAIIAYIEEFGGIFAEYQHFQVIITECENLASISGTIKDEEGNLIENSYVVLINGNLTEDGDSINYVTHIMSENGYYEFDNLDKGTYYIFAEGKGNNREDFYYGEWYDNKYDWMDADAIVLDCGYEVTVDFELEKFVEPERYWVSGNVTDELTGEALPWISVEFIGTDEKTGFTDRFAVWTNQNGNYEIKLNDNMTYIARAAGMNIGINSDTNGLFAYWPEYYDNTNDPTEATVIELTGNLEDVDFTLERIPDYENSLSGSIIDENDIAVSPAVVVAYLIDAENDAFDEMVYFGRVAEVNDDGKFELENLIPGEYVLMAHPHDRMYVPGYYKEDDFAVRSWEDATVVTVEESGNSGEYTIMLELHQKVAGKGKVRGSVGRQGKTAKITDEVASDDALVGAMIYVQNSDGKFVNTVQTDEMGQFNVEGLPNGEYTLRADKIGYFTGSTNFVIDGEEEVEVNFDLDTKAMTSVEDYFTADNANIFPNPANQNFTVEFNSLISGSITISVSNLLGNVVHEQKANASAGINQFSVDLGNQSSGTYFVKISDERGTLAITPVIIK